jgi:opacity protein-like surface antigen
MMLKKAAVIGITGLALGVSPASADSMGDASKVALTMIGGGGVMAIGCMAIALLTEDDEDTQEGYGRRGFYAGVSPLYARQNFSDSAAVGRVDGDLLDNLRKLRGTPTDTDPGNYTFRLGDLDDDAFGVAGRGGYRCHPYAAAELQFDWLDNFEGSVFENGVPMNDTTRNFDLELESLVFTANAKGHLLTGRYQPFVLLGLGFMRMESKSRDETPAARALTAVCPPDPGDPTPPCYAGNARDRRVEVALRFGGGLDFYITENVAMSAEVSYLMPTGQLDDLDYYSFGIGMQYRF